MSRLRSLRRQDLDPSGQAVWDQIVAGRGSQLVVDDGSLSGPFDAGDQSAVHQVARQLAQHGRVDDATYTAAQTLLGDAGMVELVSLCGYYTLISYQLNAFEVPLPAGEDLQWPDEHPGGR